MFLTFCEHYGVPKTNLCQTVDLYEGTNMPQFMSAVQCLGTEVSRLLANVWSSLLCIIYVAVVDCLWLFIDHKGYGLGNDAFYRIQQQYLVGT